MMTVPADAFRAILRSQDSSSFLQISTLGYQFPDESEGWDADWYVMEIQLTIPSFKFQWTGPGLSGVELDAFCGQLQNLSTMNQTSAMLAPLEPYIEIEMTLTPSKHVAVSGTVRNQYHQHGGGELTFEFETDLTYLDTFITDIKSTLSEFPPRRTPNA